VARRRWLDVVLAALVLPLAVDIGRVAQKPMTQSMWMVPPDRIPTGRPFHFEQEPPFQYKRRDWAGPMYLAMLGDTGVINCYGAPPFDRKGAKPITAPDYRGEAYLVTPSGATAAGSAKVVRWSPNHATLEVEGAEPGSLLVYNMNFDEGWRADAGPVIAHKNALAVRLASASASVTFSYRPPWLGAGVLACALAVGAVALLRRRERPRG
jgi:hypothetical protein